MGVVCYSRPVRALLIATDNRGKRAEYKSLLAPFRATLRFPDQLGLQVVAREAGRSYAENAAIKALSHAQASGLATLADDSGLEVDALGGEPGLYSARYAGEKASDADRYRLLLEKLTAVPWERRTARFRCCVVLAKPDGRTHTAEGVCEGVIALEPRGEHGFGYDPVFYLPEHGRTLAQLPSEVKNRLSHRARALEKLLPTLTHVLRESPEEG